MTINATFEKKNNGIVIDDAYLSRFESIADARPVLDKDLDEIAQTGGTVYLHPPRNPRLSSLYTDVRAHVGLKSTDHESGQSRYSVVSDKFDTDMLKQILGALNITGTPQTGYRFQRAGQY